MVTGRDEVSLKKNSPEDSGFLDWRFNLCVAGVQVKVVSGLNFGWTGCENTNVESLYPLTIRLLKSFIFIKKNQLIRISCLRTVFKDKSNHSDRLSADEHDGIVSGCLREGLGLAVGVQDKATTLVEQLLVVKRNTRPASQQLLEQRCPVETTWRAFGLLLYIFSICCEIILRMLNTANRIPCLSSRCHLRVVLVDVDVVQRRLLQAEDINHRPVQDVIGLGEELVEAPAFLLICLQDVGEHRGQETLEPPGGHI